MNKKEMKIRGVAYRGFIAGVMLTGLVAVMAKLSRAPTIGEKQNQIMGDFFGYDINNDGLIDLVGKKGNSYLQTKEGNFVSYEEALDSLKKSYLNKLEKLTK